MSDNTQMIDLTSEALVFYHVALLRGFRAAGSHLQMSKSMVSSKVASLEARTGKRLLHRSTRDVSLTHEGEIYFEACKKLVEATRWLQSNEARFKSELSGTFAISAPHDFMTIWLVPMLTKFQELHPQLKFRLLSSDRILNLEQDKIDLSVRFGAEKGAHLIRNKFTQIEFGFFCRQDHLPEKPGTQELVDWIQEQGVYTFRPAREKHFRVNEENLDVKSRTDFQVHDVLSLKALLLEGGRIGILPKFAVQREITSGVIRELLPSATIKGVTAHFVSGARRQDDARLEAIVAFLQNAAKSIH